MKKLLVLATMATLLMAGSAFAVERHFGAAPNATFAFGAPANGQGYGPTTTNNDDSCDISVAPAATLLLPVFQVDMDGTHNRETTLFTITNVSRYPQIAHVTIWTEYSVPVLDFNIFLTGYDVQGINLYDVLFSGQVAGSNGTSSSTTPGTLSATNTSNPNFRAAQNGGINCATLPGQLPTSVYTAAATALQTGAWAACGSGTVAGGSHSGVARGYVTVDVANNCSTSLPTDAGYFANAANPGSGEVLFDNVLIGDYEQVGQSAVGTTATGFDGAGNPMVHIRAIPEGGPATLVVATTLPFTFYDRYTNTSYRRADRRQPLPSTWAARFIQNTANQFSTNYKIWREGKLAGNTCTSASSLTGNAAIPIAEIVRFDEAENPYTYGSSTICSPCTASVVTLPEASITNTTSTSVFPPNATSFSTAANGGWMYLNLNNGGSTNYSVQANPVTTGFTSNSGNSNLLPGGAAAPATVSNAGPRPSQNWVIVQMFAANVSGSRMSVDFDAAWLGNGCSQAASPAGTGPGTIGPATTDSGTNNNGNGELVCAPTQSGCTTGINNGSNITPVP